MLISMKNLQYVTVSFEFHIPMKYKTINNKKVRSFINKFDHLLPNEYNIAFIDQRMLHLEVTIDKLNKTFVGQLTKDNKGLELISTYGKRQGVIGKIYPSTKKPNKWRFISYKLRNPCHKNPFGISLKGSVFNKLKMIGLMSYIALPPTNILVAPIYAYYKIIMNYDNEKALIETIKFLLKTTKDWIDFAPIPATSVSAIKTAISIAEPMIDKDPLDALKEVIKALKLALTSKDTMKELSMFIIKSIAKKGVDPSELEKLTKNVTDQAIKESKTLQDAQKLQTEISNTNVSARNPYFSLWTCQNCGGELICTSYVFCSKCGKII